MFSEIIWLLFIYRDVKYIWYGMSYKRLRKVLKDGNKLRAFPLVDSPGSMVLLGSIQRGELVSTISELIGKERRHQVCMERYGFKLKQMQLREQKEMEQRIEDKIQQKADERIQQVHSFYFFKPMANHLKDVANFNGKVENILKDSLDSIPSPLPSIKI